MIYWNEKSSIPGYRVQDFDSPTGDGVRNQIGAVKRVFKTRHILANW